jgi:2-oxo-4-hydroxy-4-carboxy-5-ureidoimidazoline decarboxylase
MTHHPRIGDVSKLREKYKATATWSSQEQRGVQEASEEVLQGLADGNREYEARFGFIFLVCATGKSAGEMLALLRERMNNEPEAELRIAAGEQAKITRIRLEKLLTSP